MAACGPAPIITRGSWRRRRWEGEGERGKRVARMSLVSPGGSLLCKSKARARGWRQWTTASQWRSRAAHHAARAVTLGLCSALATHHSVAVVALHRSVCCGTAAQSRGRREGKWGCGHWSAHSVNTAPGAVFGARPSERLRRPCCASLREPTRAWADEAAVVRVRNLCGCACG